MGFMSEIEEDILDKEKQKVSRQQELETIINYCIKNNLPIPDQLEKDKILNPENFDGFGIPLRFIYK